MIGNNKFIASKNIEVYLNIGLDLDCEYFRIDPENYKYYPLEDLNIFITPKEIIKPRYFNIYKENIICPEINTSTSGLKEDSYKGIILKGTTYYISDNLDVIIPELLYITSEKLMKHKDTDISDLYKYGVDVYTKDHKRFKVTSGKYNIDDIIGIFVDKNKVMSIDKTSIYYNNIKIPEKPKRYYNIDPFEDVYGYENTQLLKKYNIQLEEKDNWYVPAMGELIEIYKNLFKINLTLKYLKKEIIDINLDTSFLSSTFRTYNTCWSLNLHLYTLGREEISINEIKNTYLFYRTE